MSLEMKIIHVHPYKNPLLFFGNAFDLSPRSLGKMLVDAAGAALTSVTVVPAGQPAARVTAAWVSGAVPASTGAPVTFLGWPGMQVQAQFQPSHVGSSFPAGTVVGNLTVRANGQVHEVPVRATSPLPGPSLQWRLRHV